MNHPGAPYHAHVCFVESTLDVARGLHAKSSKLLVAESKAGRVIVA